MASKCSSGCESGWTLYLEQSFVSPSPSHRRPGFDSMKGFCGKATEKSKTQVVEEVDVEEEEDLSMVSDASSGPPHVHEDDGYFGENRYHHYPESEGAALVQSDSKRCRNKEHQRRSQDPEMFSFLDDTASSPLINFSQNNLAVNNNQASMENVLDYSQGFSASHFEGRPLFQDHFGFFQSSLSSNQLQRNQWY
ncbi:hypothetical protein SLEP1_g30023 [Rubroshorea leprosula]|uniref:Uncharacterized protein n=1 Tax=Rubroshorea leprosula TaxID=152421 RepID=A0AAV5K5K1_9ROSI|nr:hypothetical protein SLEP1_g30023 [Rubroshorea leprosula]